MRLIFKQRMFSWFDSYDVYDEFGNTVFTVVGRMSFGKRLEIHDASGRYLGMLKQKVFSWYPTFEIYMGDMCVGSIRKEFAWFKPQFFIDCNGWQVEGNFWEWDYSIRNSYGGLVAMISKQRFNWTNWTDTYALDVFDPIDAPAVLMVALAIDAEKDNRN